MCGGVGTASQSKTESECGLSEPTVNFLMYFVIVVTADSNISSC